MACGVPTLSFRRLGLQHTTASRLTVFLYTSPFWVALLVPLWVKSEKLRGLQWVGLLSAFVAVVFASREGFTGEQASTAYGDMLALLAGMLWGLTTVVIRATGLAKISAEKLLFTNWRSAHWRFRPCHSRWARCGSGNSARSPSPRCC